MQILPTIYLAIQSLLRVNGQYWQTAKHAETGMTQKAKNLPFIYLAIHSLFRVNGHYCQTETHAEAGMTQNANRTDNLPSYTIALPTQRSLL